MSNVIKFTDESLISVRLKALEAAHSFMNLEIEDSGVGISASEFISAIVDVDGNKIVMKFEVNKKVFFGFVDLNRRV